MKSILRGAVHAAALAPLAVLAIDFFNHNLTANPIQAATQRSGDIALALLTATLACTPVNILFDFPAVLPLRKTLGLYTFFYATLHLFIYTFDYGFDWRVILASFWEKRFIFVGLAAFLILFLMTLTSFKWWKVIMGKNWKILQRLFYAAGLLAVLHDAWALKGDIFRLKGNIQQPLIYGVLIIILLAVRLPLLRCRLNGILSFSKRHGQNSAL
jgi:methionine sulfoxide reductase heme-binding subunit